MQDHFLSVVTFVPLIGALIMMFLPKDNVNVHRGAAMFFSVLTFVLSLGLLKSVDTARYHFQLIESVDLFANLGIKYKVGIDGLSLWLYLLTTFLSVIAIWFSFYVDKRVKDYMISLLMLETAMLGVFISLDLILFFTFFEATLIPMYLLINIWGGARRAYAAVKFFLYTAGASIFLLIGIIALGVLHMRTTGQMSFDIIDIQQQVALGTLYTSVATSQIWIFWAFMLAFLVKCPAFPFHTWLPDAHVEAPTAGSVILAGVLLKMGTYGMLRFVLPFFPDVLPSQIPIIMGLAVIGIIYGAVVAAVQPDWKKLVAYSSVSHMGFVLLGIFSLNHTGIMGGAMQQLNHGISTGALFLLIGLIYERRHTRMFKDFGGIKAQMPIYSWLFLIVMFSSVGLPTTNGFVGEFAAMLGAFESSYSNLYGLSIGYAVVAGAGVILAAVYLLYMFMRVFYGANDNPENQRLKDLKPHEIAMVGLFIIFIFWGGLQPNTFLKPMEASVLAAREMALNPPKSRPMWSREDMRIELEPGVQFGNLYAKRGGGKEVLVFAGNVHVPLKIESGVKTASNSPEVKH